MLLEHGLGLVHEGNPLPFQQRPAPNTGIYSVALLSGTIAAGLAGDSELLQFRWTAASLCLIHEVTLDGLGVTATGFTAGLGRFYGKIARGFTVDGSGGGTATLTTNNGKLRTSMGVAQVGSIRIATTAALGAGTKTLDAQPFGQVALAFPTTASVNLVPQPVKLFNTDGVNSSPIILAQNEGIILHATVPATGTWHFGATIKWSEAASF